MGHIRNIKEVIVNTEKYINDILNTDKFDLDIQENDAGRLSKVIEKEILKSDIVIDIDQLNCKIKSLFKDIDKIEGWYRTAIDYYRKNENQLKGKLIKLRKETEDNEQTSLEYEKYKIVLKIAFVPASIITNIVRYIAYVLFISYEIRYTSTFIEPANPIYHLSDNDNLNDELLPRINNSNIGEYLPKRISFSSDILSACYGIPGYFNNDVDYKDLYVYQGIQEKGKTMYLKPELVNFATPATIQHNTKEICVSTPIKIRKIMKVRIYHKTNYNKFKLGKYYRFDILEKY